jgi:hypothetical protein
VVGWLAVGLFWLVLTHRFHPTGALAIITTASLVSAYATASYVNHLSLVPRYYRRGHYGRYVAGLVVTMAILTALALAVIRTCYITTLGPDPDPNGVYVHYGIDFIGMAVHLLIAACVVWAVGKLSQPPQRDAKQLPPVGSPPE